jgi:hypothetical protein
VHAVARRVDVAGQSLGGAGGEHLRLPPASEPGRDHRLYAGQAGGQRDLQLDADVVAYRHLGGLEAGAERGLRRHQRRHRRGEQQRDHRRSLRLRSSKKRTSAAR